jgi:transmembrane sensor
MIKKMDKEPYNTYTTDDFILDEDFRKIVRESGSNDRLKELLKALPDKKQEINLSVQILCGMHSELYHQSEPRKKELWTKIIQGQKKQVRLLYFRYAASILLLIGIGSGVFYLSTQKPADVVVANEPPGNDAQLILADGKTVSISCKQSTVRYSPDGSEILVNDSSGLAQSVSGIGSNKMIVPYGKRSYIMLSEGTKIWLNSGSTLIFPPVFKGKTREVFLDGEAFFDVARDKGKPFFVKTDVFKMKVYGTKFNVQAYRQDKDYDVVLVEGKVSLNANKGSHSQEVFLLPNQKASILSNDGKKFEITNVENIENYTAWINGYLTFTNEEIPDLLKRVSRYYNSDIEVELHGNVQKIYGKLDLKDDLERVLEGIAFISKTKFKKEGNKYVFYD